MAKRSKHIDLQAVALVTRKKDQSYGPPDVFSKASAMEFFKGAGKRCAVFGCDKHLKWSDFVVDEASELALREYYRRQARTRQDADGHPYGQLM